MSLISIVRDYINRMLQDISGMKVLILDSITVSIVSVAYSQSELLQKEVFLVELVDTVSKEPMAHLKAVCFLRPTSENIQKLRRQLSKPRFGEYHLFFSSILKIPQIQVLADSDEQEVVQQVQAMVHELVGIQDNKVDMKNIGKVPKDQQEVVLSSEQDAFFKANMYENFGDLGMNIKRMVDDFQHITKSNQNIQTIEDMAKFVDNYPEYRKMHGNVSKHVTMVTELSRIVEERKLMLVSQTEQELACTGGQVAAFEAVTNLLNNESVSDIDCLRLVMLYALRYEKEGPVQLMQLLNKLASRSANYKSGHVHFLLQQAGVEKRTGDLYGNRDLMNIARNMARGLQGVENVYTQHQPLLFQTMESITKGRLKDVDYPFVGNHFQQGRPQEVVVFIVGGTTYEEARTVALHNTANSGTHFILGGSEVLNSKRFLKDVEEAHLIARASVWQLIHT